MQRLIGVVREPALALVTELANAGSEILGNPPSLSTYTRDVYPPERRVAPFVACSVLMSVALGLRDCHRKGELNQETKREWTRVCMHTHTHTSEHTHAHTSMHRDLPWRPVRAQHPL